jgi:hypothetical protein
MKKIAFAALLPLVCFALPASAAEDAKGGETEFGNAGVLNIGASTGLGLEFGSSKSPDPPDGNGEKTSSTRFGITAALDYFVIDGLSVGAAVLFDTRSSKTGDDDKTKFSTTAWGVGPRVGYNLWLTPGQFSLWPTLQLAYLSGSSKKGDADGPTTSKTNLEIFVPFVIHPVKHFHFAVGPVFGMDLSSNIKPPNGDSVKNDKDTVFGLRGEIAGWL